MDAAPAGPRGGAAFAPTSGGLGLASRYHHIIRMSSGTFHEEILALLKLLEVNTSRVLSSLLSKRTRRHRTNASSSGQLRQYFSKRVALLALRVYQVDYDEFKLEKPVWLQQVLDGP